MQALDISQPPMFEIENESLRIGPNEILKQLIVRIGKVNQEVRTQAAGQQISQTWVFFKNNYTLSHTTPKNSNRRQRRTSTFD